ncbi:MAG: DNA-binding protein [Clostridia bacterium]|nr:DNA-binding protein [Clostridia bacterium]
MEYRKFGDTYFVRMDRGEEVLAQLTALCRKENIRLATVEALGAVDHAVVSVYDVPTRAFFKKEFDGPMEISNLCGTVTRKDGEVYIHLHVTVCDRELNAHGGHMNELRVAATCEMTVRTLPGEVGRRLNEEVGLNTFLFDGE